MAAATATLADGTANARRGILNGTSFWFQVCGLTNRAYIVQTSANLNSTTNWHPIFTNYASYFYTNFSRRNDRQRFYRSITNN